MSDTEPRRYRPEGQTTDALRRTLRDAQRRRAEARQRRHRESDSDEEEDVWEADETEATHVICAARRELEKRGDNA